MAQPECAMIAGPTPRLTTYQLAHDAGISQHAASLILREFAYLDERVAKLEQQLAALEKQPARVDCGSMDAV